MSPLPLGGAHAPSDAELGTIAQVLYEHAGIVLAPGKASMVQSRLGKRLRALGLKDYASYIKLVTSDEGQDERREMISALTTNVTNFFRENHHFDTLRNTALPPLLAKARAGQKVRIWSAGCSNGQEAFTIAMVLADMAQDLAKLDIRILATDIDPRMVARGREALYDAATLATIPKPMQRFAQLEAGGVRIVPPLRALVSFNELNLHQNWPMKGKFDIIFCRNVVIYFSPEDQAKLWKRFEAQLAPGGWLFVGHSERVPLDGGTALTTAGITTYRLPEAASPNGGPKWH
ncbi:CheR family methyltransferase [Rhodobacter sp. TJ_12]|uniref:CheR family methyltransferase n=1 Tax=Rhodobacter sp. TJ_12 TaxID=2029399 RepID=UPI001CC0D10E|nr:protein-glutamate O-methyltransferase [Rhodobacter sp. TJ_12]